MNSAFSKQSFALSLNSFTKLFVSSLLCCIILSEIYQRFPFRNYLNIFTIPLVHTLISIAVVIIWCLKSKGSIFKALCITEMKLKYSLWFLPGLGVIIGTWLLVLLTSNEYPLVIGTLGSKQLSSIFWVPIVEELTFRVGLGFILLRLGGSIIWASYFSILIFTVMHGLPSYEDFLSGNIGFFLGPFVLAVFCEAIYRLSHKIIPCIFLHSACNSSAVIFSWGGGYWLEKLSYLYL